jgi:hypothetical protein
MTKSTGKAIETANNIQLALEARRKDSTLSLGEASVLFKVSKPSIYNHENTIKKENETPICYAPDYHVKFQRFTPLEEVTLVVHINICYCDGFPLSIPALRAFVNELLKMNKNERPVSETWHLRFFERQENIKSRFDRLMDKQRVLAEDPDIYIDFFQKFRKAVREYKIAIDDMYNMNEVGAAIDLFHKFRIIVLEEEVAAYSSINSNREWVTLIECIYADNITLPFFSLFKARGSSWSLYLIL